MFYMLLDAMWNKNELEAALADFLNYCDHVVPNEEYVVCCDIDYYDDEPLITAVTYYNDSTIITGVYLIPYRIMTLPLESAYQKWQKLKSSRRYEEYYWETNY